MKYCFLILTLVFVGCAPKVNVVKLCGNDSSTQGIRYYRPKPYLLITPVNETTTTEKDKTKTTTSTPGAKYVNMNLEYLPDYGEEYAIQVRPGLGTADVKIELEDGWKLASLNQTLDTKFSENLQALTGAAETVVGATLPTPAASGSGAEKSSTGSAGTRVVQSSNVPLGYYESVVGLDGHGRKQMYGWRYIGFLPFSNCPPEVCGRGGSQNCNSITLYGLVFRDGIMEFRPIGDVAGLNGATSELVVAEASQQDKTMSVDRTLKITKKEEADGEKPETEEIYTLKQKFDADPSTITVDSEFIDFSSE